jgi:CTD kinase subunit beta
MHDTLKKPRELLAASYTIRFPELAAKSKNASGEIDLEHMDPAVRFLMRVLPSPCPSK